MPAPACPGSSAPAPAWTTGLGLLHAAVGKLGGGELMYVICSIETHCVLATCWAHPWHWGRSSKKADKPLLPGAHEPVGGRQWRDGQGRSVPGGARRKPRRGWRVWRRGRKELPGGSLKPDLMGQGGAVRAGRKELVSLLSHPPAMQRVPAREPALRGHSPKDPALLLCLLLHGYFKRSSCKKPIRCN